MASDDIGITFLGTFYKASTLVEGGWRLSVDVDSQQASKIIQLSAIKDSLLQFAIIPVDVKEKSRGPF